MSISKAAQPFSLFFSQISNRRFGNETLRLLESLLVCKDVESLMEVQSSLTEFIRFESVSVMREITGKTDEQKLGILEFFVRAFALLGDTESCLALKYEALLLREIKFSSFQSLEVSYGEWLNFAEQLLDCGFYPNARQACENALSCLQKGDVANSKIGQFSGDERVRRLQDKAVKFSAVGSGEHQEQVAGDIGTIENDHISQEGRSEDGLGSGYEPSQETDPSEDPSFTIKVNPSESSYLNYNVKSSRTPPSQDSVTRIVRSQLPMPSAPFRGFDLSFISKRISGASGSNVAPSAESLQIARATIKRCLTLELSALDSTQVTALKSSVKVFSSSLQSDESKKLLSSLAKHVSDSYDSLNSDTIRLLQLEEDIQAYTAVVHLVKEVNEKATNRALLDRSKEQLYKEKEDAIRALEGQISQVRAEMDAIDQERAQFVLEHQEDLTNLDIYQEAVVKDKGKVEENMKEMDELVAKRVAMLEAWRKFRNIDLDSLE